MKNAPRIVLCGASIYMLAIESGLCAMAAGDVVRINPDCPDPVERISAIKPQVVIIETNGKNNQPILENLHRSIPLIVLDEARRSIKILGNGHIPISDISELTNVIERINQGQGIYSGEVNPLPEEL